MANFTKTNEKWEISPQVSKTITLQTEGKYVDSDIIIKSIESVGVAATPSLAITDKASTNLTVGTLASGYYPFTTSLTGKMTFGTAGWIATTGASATDSSVTVGRLPAAVGSITMTAGTGVLTKGNGIGTSTSDTYNCGFSLSGKGSVSAKAKITTAGYTPTNNSFATGALTSSNASTTEYINSLTIPAGKTFGSDSAKNAITLVAGTAATPTGAYMTMEGNTILYLTDSVTGKTWKIKCDSTNDALSIWQ